MGEACARQRGRSAASMCHKCVKSADLERGGSVLDTGAYLLNFAGCAGCSRMDGLQMTDRSKSESKQGSDDVETVTYVHACACGHVVAAHHYSWTCSDTQHVYEMQCDLCGNGEHEQDIYLD